jgi:glycyl-tRNA synthetase
MREFEQMEMQYFVRPGTAGEWFERWKKERMRWYIDLGIDSSRLRFREHDKDELAHYAERACDIQYQFSFGWQEIEGIHNRTDFDLKRHSESSGRELSYFDEAAGEKYIPHIIETSAGLDRVFLCCMSSAYAEEPDRKVLRFNPLTAPYKAGVYPLVKRDGMPEIARGICSDLRNYVKVFYDDSGSIGRRYRRQDEAGTPFGITVDSRTLEDQTVTIRYRDDMKQERLKIEEVSGKILSCIDNARRTSVTQK